MGLKDTLIKAVKTASEATGDLRTSVVYHRVTGIGNYDPSLGVSPLTKTTHSITIPLVRTKEKEFDSESADKNAQKAIIPYDDLEFTPSADDYLMIDSEKWEIMDVMRVPGDSVFILMIRKP